MRTGRQWSLDRLTCGACAEGHCHKNTAEMECKGRVLCFFDHRLFGQARFPAQVCELTGGFLGGRGQGERGHFGADGFSAAFVGDFHAAEYEKCRREKNLLEITAGSDWLHMWISKHPHHYLGGSAPDLHHRRLHNDSAAEPIGRRGAADKAIRYIQNQMIHLKRDT